MRDQSSAIDALFWRRYGQIDRSDPTACWEWPGRLGTEGYGEVSTSAGGVRIPSQRAHRLAYERLVGPIPPGLVVCHRCDNPSCVNPAHLFVGTRSRNMLDAVAKGRHFTPWPSTITGAQREEIKRLAADGVSQIHLALRFKVSRSTIGRIIRS